MEKLREENTRLEDASVFALRLVVAFIFLWHGLPKALDPGMAMEKFVGFGLPGILGPVIGWIETAAALLILAGVGHRWACLALAVVIAGALATVQIPGGLSAGLERDVLILVATVFLAVHGPGKANLAARVATRNAAPASDRPGWRAGPERRRRSATP